VKFVSKESLVSAIPKTMRAVVYRGVNDLRLETVPVPRLGVNELLVKVAVCGVCPTDIKKIRHGTVPPPRIFGHETAGTIVKIGGGNSSLVTRHASLKVGDRVALHHHVPCLDCHYCRHRAFAQCATYKRTGITAGFEPAGGGYAEYVRVMPFVLPGVVKIPAKNSFEEGAMLEPVNTVLKAVRRLELLRGDTVLVAGQGPIGLMFTKLLQLAGMKVLATDLLESRLKLAQKFGATRAILANQLAANFSSLFAADGGKNSLGPASRFEPRNDGDPPLPAGGHPLLHSQWRRGTGRGGAPLQGEGRRKLVSPLDAAVIAVPSDAAVHQALQLVRGAGKVLLFAHTKRADVSPLSAASGQSGSDGGEGRGEVVQTSKVHQPSTLNPQLDLASICLDEKDLIGSYSSDFTLQREVARLVFSRQLDVRSLITHHFPLAQTADAIALAGKPAEDSLKIVVQAAG
jgi:L-iditol 2-dehydrogenase